MTLFAGEDTPRSSVVDFAVRAVPALLFGLRLAVAILLALYIAFYLQLESPFWAGTSAAAVCQPIVGSSVRKGLFRLIGTIVGAVAAMALMAVFPQDRLGFLFGMLLWGAACSFVSTLLRNFAAYAAMLAGYTLIIVAGSAIASPDQVFEVAVSRASEISIGIVCGTLVMALTDLGQSARRLSDLLHGLIVETAAHLSDVLARAGARDIDGQQIRSALLRRTAALDTIIDQAIGESPELLQNRSILDAAMNGLFAALSGLRIVETHLLSLPPAQAREDARIVLNCLPPQWRISPGVDGPSLQTAFNWHSALSVLRNIARLDTRSVSVRLTADGAADVASGLAAAANGLALLNDPAAARDLARPSDLYTADYLPALVNAVRVFVGVGATVLFWIVTAWPSGLQAVIFAAVTIILFSPQQENSGAAALSLGAGTALAAVVVAVVKFAALPNQETFPAFALIVAAALVPMGALSTVPFLARVMGAASINFVPLLSPTNQISFDTAAYFNSALGLISGCAVGAVALVVIPAVSPRLRSQRLVDLSLRDLRRLAAGGRDWTRDQWRSLIYARLAALPEDADPVTRSYLVTALSVGLQVIQLRKLFKGGHTGVEISGILESLAAGDLPALRRALASLEQELAAVPGAQPGARGRLQARAALLAIVEAVNRRAEYFEGLSP